VVAVFLGVAYLISGPGFPPMVDILRVRCFSYSIGHSVCKAIPLGRYIIRGFVDRSSLKLNAPNFDS
jgi:hypothetical protein